MEVLIPKKGQSLMNEYRYLWDKYTKKFGEKLIVFMQVGSFYEIYQWTDAKTGRIIGNAAQIHDLFTWQLGSKPSPNKRYENEPVGTIKHPYMTGCPDHTFDFNVVKATNQGFHVVIVDQEGHESKPDEARCRRIVRCVLSPATALDYISADSYQSCFLLSMYVENQNHRSQRLGDCMLCIGLSAIDVSTGQTYVHEIFSNGGDITLPYDEAYRFINSYNPKELLVTTKHLNERLTRDFVSSMELESYNLTVKTLNKHYDKPAYRHEILSRVFPDTGLVDPVDHIQLGMNPGSLIAYVIGIQWAYQHDHDLITRLEKPIIWNPKTHLTLTYNAIHQLNVIPTPTSAKVRQNVNSLYSILNRAKTSPGKRLLKDRILAPIVNRQVLKTRYKQVGSAKSCWKPVQKLLINVMDTERLFRRVCLKRIRPTELAGFIESMQQFPSLYDFIHKQGSDMADLLPSDENWQSFQEFLQRCESVFDIPALKQTCKASQAEQSLFQSGFSPRIEELIAEIETKKNFVQNFANLLTEVVDGGGTIQRKLTIEMEMDRKGECFLRTKPWVAQLLKRIRDEIRDKPEKDWVQAATLFPDQIKLVRGLEFQILKSSAKIRSETILDYSGLIANQTGRLRELIHEEYNKLLHEFETNYYDTMKVINRFVAEIDVTFALARVAAEHKYVEPKIVEHSSSSFVAVKAIRHPIIEQVERDKLYVTNDIVVGQAPEDLSQFDDDVPRTKNGLLLFSVNGAGKSSLMKAIGLNIIMAQIGSFVPCDEFVFYPFDNIITRISGNDNMFKGQSSFAVEMSEVQTMLCRSGPNTMVLGDEICRGTNVTDAIGLVAAVIKELAEKRTNFVFASHYHAISKFQTIQALDNVAFYHLTVTIGQRCRGNQKNQEIIYERKLQKGVGQEQYGIQVAQAQGIPQKVIQSARMYVNEYKGVSNELVPTKISRYNSRKYVIECNRCQRRASDKLRLITHHIREQHTADENGFIGHIHKDSGHNIEILCEPCHIKHHQHLST